MNNKEVLLDNIHSQSEFDETILSLNKNITTLEIYECDIYEIPDSISRLVNLKEIYIVDCNKLNKISENIFGISYIYNLDLIDLVKLEYLPNPTSDKIIGNLTIDNTGIREIPKNLLIKSLDLSNNLFIEKIPNVKILQRIFIHNNPNLRELPKDLWTNNNLKNIEISNDKNDLGSTIPKNNLIPGLKITIEGKKYIVNNKGKLELSIEINYDDEKYGIYDENNNINDNINYNEKYNDKILKNMGLDIIDLQRNILENEIRYNFYCGSTMEAVYIIINEAILLTKNKGYTTPEISNFLTDLTLLSSDTIESIIYKGSIRYLSDIIVIKVSKIDSKNTIHEYNVGLALNNLRYIMPNFMYVFSNFNCGMYESGKPLCNTKGNINYLVVEMIKGKTFHDEIISGNISRDELYNWTIQILLALAMAQEKYKFIHYDLHIENIIIRRTRDYINYVYNLEGNEYWITSNIFPTIIDYGFSRITIGENDYTSPNTNIKYGLDGSFKPGIDVYKFLYTIMKALKLINSPYFIEYYSIFGEFLIFHANDNTKKLLMEDILTNSNKNNYAYPSLGDDGIYYITPMDVLTFIDSDIITKNIGINPTNGYITMGICENIENVLTKLLTPINTEKTCQGDPWKKLDKTWRDRYGNDRYWFDCGIFTFDSRFNVVTFPRGMSLYHGSPGLTFYGVEYPLGIDYYTSKKFPFTKEEKNILKNKDISDNDKKQILLNKQPITLGYYGDLEVAMRYSSHKLNVTDPEGLYSFNCGINCITAYKLKRDITMIDLYDPFNLYILLTQSYLSKESINILRQKYHIDKFIDLYKKIVPPTAISRGKIDISEDNFQKLQQAYNPFRRFIIKSERNTIRDDDYRVPKEILSLTKKYGYSGFINPRSPYINGDMMGQYRFGEFVFGSNVLDYIYRDFENVYDWQYFNNKRLFGEIGELVRDMLQYTTTNIDFHSGNLYEHSIWTALYIQNLFEIGSEWVEGLNNYDIPIAVMGGFLHDIGKSGDMVYTFYDKIKHPLIGFDYIVQNKPYYYMDKYGQQKILDINRLFRDINMDGSIAKVISLLILSHWEMGGNYVSRVNKENITKIASEFIEKMEEFIYDSKLETASLPYLLRLIMLISAADVMASSVYIPYKKLRNISYEVSIKKDPMLVIDNINAYLRDYPYLVNRPKNHRGGDKYKDFDFEKKGLILRREVLRLLPYNTLMEKPRERYVSDSDYESDDE